MFEDLPLDELHEVLGEPFAQNLLAEVARCAPIAAPSPEQIEAFLQHHGVTVGWIPRPIFDPKVLPRIDRSTAERYLTLVLERDLAYDAARMPLEDARRAARLFLAPFGPDTWFFANTNLDEDALAAREQRRSSGHGVYTQMFGNTFEEGVFAIDPAGHVGVLFVGDED